MAIPAFKIKEFATARELAAFVVSAGGGVTTVVNVIFNSASGKYTLFYT
jgi:hypothetical protein